VEENKIFLPKDLEISNEGVRQWLQKRVIPKSRAFVHEILKSLGLSSNDLKGIIDVCKGLSLNDSYWVVPADFKGTFAEYNLYENKFDKVLSLIAYTGAVHTSTHFTSSPELTTNGNLPKGWRILSDGKRYLFKGGSTGAANAGMEPYSEFYAYQIAKAMGLKAVPYYLGMWKGMLSSYCALFTDIHTSYVPIGRLVPTGGLQAVLDYYKALGDDYYDELCSMLVFDAVIYNTDRHFGNFGLLRDNRTGKFIAPAPVFDNGYSLFNFAMEDDFENLIAYAETRSTATGANHTDVAKIVMGPKQREQLRKLINFKFEAHKPNKANVKFSAKRRKQLEDFIQYRVRELLDEDK
ncbi:MAG: XRE family transcriptional regulator, partial [Peptococcaceae bacterium]|nr:XRE family transcriptional regulator [Peptococcaceae bacterium]